VRTVIISLGTGEWYTDMENLPVKPADVKGIRVGRFNLVQSSSGFVISKEGNPCHLTIAFNNEKSHLDIHVKDQQNGSYETICQIPYSDLVKHAEEAGKKWAEWFARARQPVRPGWLRRRRYHVCHRAESDLLEAFKEHSPVVKGKYRPQVPEMMSHMAADGRVYYPSILHELIHDERIGYVVASRVHRRRDDLILTKWRDGNRLRWYSVRRTRLEQLIDGFWNSETKAVVKGKLERMNQLMRFGELEAFFRLPKM
jgi:hypothetical protein